MLVSSEKEQIPLHLEHSIEALGSSPVGSNSDSSEEMLVPSNLSESPQLSTIYTDVSVVPEQERNEIQLSILNLEGEIAQLKQKVRTLNKKRGEALNKILDIKGSIRVFCRVRPFLATDWRRLREPISVGEEKVVVRSAGSRRDFRFDKVFDAGAVQEDVFVEVEPIMRSALDGHNVCILAYGQTGTGKTFTMDGTNEQPGIIPRALEVLFNLALLDNTSPVTISISMLEVYMGNLKDLLAPKVACRSYETVSKCNLNIQTDQKGLVEIENLTEIEVPDIARAKWWYSRGRRARATSWTNVNERSSRSHCLTRITISRHGDNLKAKKEVSKLWMVDLGGSERLLKTGATGLTLDEGRAINLSLSALGDVIGALRRKRGHVPYRNSKLTQILKDSLGASSKVVMLVHVSPCEDDIGETVCSLSFANRARAVDTNRELAEDIKKQRQKRISLLEDYMREAEEGIREVRSQLQKAEILLNENRKLTCQPPEEKEESTLITPLEDAEEVSATPKISDKGIRRNAIGSVPRFMTSTVASRQRQSAAEIMMVARARSLRSVARTSVQFSCSQSLNYSDIHMKAMLRESNKKPRQGEWKNLQAESLKCSASDLKASSLPQRKTVHSSDPNSKTTVSHHRRRMSDLI